MTETFLGSMRGGRGRLRTMALGSNMWSGEGRTMDGGREDYENDDGEGRTGRSPMIGIFILYLLIVSRVQK